MKVFALSEREILRIINLSSETRAHCSLLLGVIHSTGQTLCSYVYNNFIRYMRNYTILNDYGLTTHDHNLIYSDFEALILNTNAQTSEIFCVPTLDSSLHQECFLDYMYEDTYECLEKHYKEIHGSEFVHANHEVIMEDFERLMDTNTYLMKEIEARYLYRVECEYNAYILFVIGNGSLLVFIR